MSRCAHSNRSVWRRGRDEDIGQCVGRSDEVVRRVRTWLPIEGKLKDPDGVSPLSHRHQHTPVVAVLDGLDALRLHTRW